MSLQKIKKNRTQDTILGTPLSFMAEATTYEKYRVKVGVHHFPEIALETIDSLTSEDRKRSLKHGIAIRLARGRSAEQKTISETENCLRSASWIDLTE